MLRVETYFDAFRIQGHSSEGLLIIHTPLYNDNYNDMLVVCINNSVKIPIAPEVPDVYLCYVSSYIGHACQPKKHIDT